MAPKFKGIPVYLDGQEYIVPSLSVNLMEKHYSLLTAGLAESETFTDFIKARIPAIGDALRRNYPEVTDEWLMDVIDLNTYGEVVKAINAASGMKAVKPGEAVPVASSTGNGSTAV